MKSQEKILEAVSKLLPEGAKDEVSSAIQEFLNEAVSDLKKEYETKLEEAYAKVAEERKSDQKVAYEGYAQAYEMIADLRERLDLQREEFNSHLDKEYEEAYKMLEEERKKNESLEVDLYDEYDNKLSQMKNYIVDKVDAFLAEKGSEMYESARKDVLNDPTFAEHKLALDKILEVAARYMDDEDFYFANSSRLDELTKQLEETKAHLKTLEAKNLRLATENHRLVDANNKILNESVKVNQNERLQKAGTAEGRGQVVEANRQVVIGEWQNNDGKTGTDERGQTFNEQQVDLVTQWQRLAGMNKK